MSEFNNCEPRRFWKSLEAKRTRVPCVSCGAPARHHAANLPFCNTCLGSARQRDLAEWAEHDD